MAKILLYGFSHPPTNISGQIISKLSKSNCDTFLINTRYKSQALADIQKLLAKIQTGDYKYILGLGQFTSKKNLLKIETICINRFRNNKIYIHNSPDTYHIGQFLANLSPPLSTSIVSQRTGDSWCNQTAYHIAHLIDTQNLSCQSSFLHISRNYPLLNIQKILNQVIYNLSG